MATLYSKDDDLLKARGSTMMNFKCQDHKRTSKLLSFTYNSKIAKPRSYRRKGACGFSYYGIVIRPLILGLSSFYFKDLSQETILLYF